MRFPDPLVPGRLVRRYKRFLADVTLADGAAVTAHCPNPGSMLGLSAPGSAVWLSRARNPARKLAYTLELVQADGGLVGVNTGHPNGVAAAAIAAGRVPELAGYPTLRREVRYGRNSRIDLLLGGDGRPPCYVEVKNVHLMREAGLAEFPDARTARGAKHLDELGEVAAAGQRAVMFFLAQRADCQGLRLAADIDPHYVEAMRRARARGVEVLCYCCKISLEAIELDRPLALDF